MSCPNDTPTRSQGLMGEAEDYQMSVFLLLQHNPTGNQQGPSQQLPRLSRQHTRHWHSPRPPDVRIQGPLTCPAAADQGACPRTSTDNLCCTQLCRHFLKRGDPFQFSPSVVSDSLRPHGLQHARPPCPSPTLEFAQTHVHRVSDAIQPSPPLSSPSPPAFYLSQHQGLFQ